MVSAFAGPVSQEAGSSSSLLAGRGSLSFAEVLGWVREEEGVGVSRVS